jgi:hypothetical protein
MLARTKREMEFLLRERLDWYMHDVVSRCMVHVAAAAHASN